MTGELYTGCVRMSDTQYIGNTLSYSKLYQANLPFDWRHLEMLPPLAFLSVSRADLVVTREASLHTYSRCFMDFSLTISRSLES
jgi:hypothetical protein